MTSMSVRVQRTIGSWRWWILLPLFPLFFVCFFLSDVMKYIDKRIKRVLDWKRRNDP